MLSAGGNQDSATPRQAELHVTMAVSPTLSLSDPKAALEVNVSARIADSAKPGEPITFLAHRTVFEVFHEGEGGMDMFSRGAFGRLLGVDREENSQTGKNISLGYFRVNEVMRSDAPDLRERGLELLTVPGDGSAVTVTHQLAWERIFRYEEKLSKGDVKPGEKYRMGLSTKFIHTGWWCFGDLQADLKDKKFCTWDEYDKKPDDASLREGNWVLSEEPTLLKWKKVVEDGDATVEIVE